MSILQYLLFSGASILEFKHAVYNGFHIYAVKRANANMTMFSGLYDNEALPSWWCGYVEVPLDMYGLLKPGGYLNEKILYDELDDLDKYGLTCVHEGYTYIDYGIPLVLDEGQRLFLGWDYNHWPDTENCVTYQEILKEGIKVVDSMQKFQTA